jgi:hypothetical protein
MASSSISSGRNWPLMTSDTSVNSPSCFHIATFSSFFAPSQIILSCHHVKTGESSINPWVCFWLPKLASCWSVECIS